jgi:hypothetical protein
MKKKFFKIVDLDAELTGASDGLAQAKLVRDSFTHKNRYDEYMNYFLSYKEGWFYNQTEFPSVDFNLEYVKLKKQALLTDFVYFGPSFYHRFLVSEKVQLILRKYKLPPYKFYESRLYANKKFTDEYKFFYCPSIGYDIVDFKESVFSKGNKKSGKEFVKVNSKDDFLEIKAPLNRERIILKSDFDPTLDFFNLLISSDPIISENLYNELLEQNVTGIKMIELNESEFGIQSEFMVK